MNRTRNGRRSLPWGRPLNTVVRQPAVNRNRMNSYPIPNAVDIAIYMAVPLLSLTEESEQQNRPVLCPRPKAKRKFLGYTFTMHYQPRLKVAPGSVKRLKGRLPESFRRGRGRNLGVVLKKLRPVLLGLVSYYRKSEVRTAFEQLDQWMRRKLRAIL